MANMDIKYGFIVNLTSTLAMGEFDNKKGIFFIFHRQTLKLTLNFVLRGIGCAIRLKLWRNQNKNHETKSTKSK
jgi:hypothetical protein